MKAIPQLKVNCQQYEGDWSIDNEDSTVEYARVSNRDMAHLFAAAPDLLAAARRALSVLKAQGESVRPGNALGALDAAIAKATGQQATAAR